MNHSASIRALTALSDPCADPVLMQQRLALLGKVIFIIALGFFVVQIGISVGLAQQPLRLVFAAPSAWAHLAGTSTMGLLWLVCSRAPGLSRRALGGLEVASLTGCCLAWCLMISPEDSPGPAVISAVMLTVMARAVIVPSTAGRTLWITIVAAAPMLLIQNLRFPEFTPPPGLTREKIMLMTSIGSAMWIAATTACAAVASRIIYGLCREVAAAREIGQYTLEQKLGGGGMGEVWRASHRLLIRPAAIKIINRDAIGASSSGPEVLLRRFEREARTTAALRSPHTVQLYDFGITNDGGLYYVMELLEGLDLDSLVRRYGPVPAERAIHMLLQVCRSLAEAHAAALVHRDLKPANLFVTRAGTERDFVKVLDFGLVKLGRGRDDRRSLDLTAVGATPGTPAYMAPELVRADADLDHRADIYSLGCVAYWLVTGLPVFDGETPIKVMLDHVHTQPLAPSTRTELAIPPAFEQLILACLAKDPADRPQSALELADRLQACASASTWSEQRAERWWDLHLPEAQARPLAEVLRSREVGRSVLAVARKAAVAVTAMVALVLGAGRASAQPATDVGRGPLPTEASGIAVAPATPVAEQLLWVPRAVLFVPRWTFWLAAQPVRLAAWSYENYQLGALYRRGLLAVDEKFGVWPTLSVGGGFGLNVGARIVHRDLFGAGEHLTLNASFGGELQQAYAVKLTSGDRLGDRIRIGLAGRYERRPHDRFYGIGNGDVVGAPEMPVDPTVDPTAVETRFREERVTAALTVDARITDELGVRLSAARAVRTFATDPDDARSIDRTYDRMALAGFETGLDNLYVEGELRYDSRRPTSIYQSRAMDATGWLASAYVGGTTGFDQDRSDFYRYGVELQRYLDLHQGTRVLALRVLVESVGGTDGGADGQIAFADLPRLGGLDDLRGYQAGRFRDRALMLASAEYTWDLGNYLAAFTFVDAGRVQHSLAHPSFEDLRIGFGGGIQMHTKASFVARGQVAATRDGDVMFQLSFAPAFGRRERAGRY